MINMLKVKQKMKTKKSNLLAFSRLNVGIFIVSGLLLVVGTSFPSLRAVVADTCSSITDCQNQIAANNNAVAQLQDQATSYQDAISHLNGQITQIQTSISANITQQAQIQQQIVNDQVQIDHARAVLSTDVKTMYVDGNPTTIEMLATSKNLSDFVDKQEYRTSVQNKLQDTMRQIADLQKQLQTQKTQVEALLAQQQTQQSQLSAAQAQQVNLLSYNQSQQASYDAQTASNKQKLVALIAAQQRANNSSKNGALMAGSTSYPYANYGFSMSTAPGCNNGDGPDAWGYCTRQCVSYAAWAVAHSNRNAPIDYGNAANWLPKALNAGVPVYTLSSARASGGVNQGSPQPGDVAISTAGTWGHAMYIEQVSGSQIYVSQYNANLDGQFSYQWRDASNYYFLRFP